MEDLFRETSRIDILNEKCFLDRFQVELVDFSFNFAARTDREENKATALINFELVAKVITNLKLNPIGHDDQSYLSDLESAEIHFVKLKTDVEKLDITFRQILKLFRIFPNLYTLDFEPNWVLVDIDNHLKGNPHISD